MGIFNRKKDVFDYEKTRRYFEANRDTRRENFLRCPDWLRPEYDADGDYQEEPDALYMLFDAMLQRRFFQEGKVALGALVQANELLFKRGFDDCPANYIYTRDEYYIKQPGELEGLAYALFDTKGKAGYYPSIQKLADLLADETERIYCYKLPRDVTEGREVYFTTVFVSREHLPQGRIVESLKPMLILPYNEPDAMILPHWYWQV